MVYIALILSVINTLILVVAGLAVRRGLRRLRSWTNMGLLGGAEAYADGYMEGEAGAYMDAESE